MKTRGAMDQVSWTNVRDYLVSRGFRLLPTGRTDAGVYRYGDVEVRVPFDPTFDDYHEALERAVRAVARFEQRTVDQVIADLVMPKSDRLRFAQTGEGTADGMIAVDLAPALVEGARKALLASAHSEERPDARYHKRMSRSIPEAFLRACRLGPAEQRSFAFSIHCPHDLPDELPVTQFGRRTVVRLMQSVTRTVQTLVRLGPQAIVDAHAPMTTANLCEALVQMMPRDERTDLALDVRYSPILPAPDGTPTEVRIERSLYRAFEDLSRMLRPPQSPIEDVHVGRVVELRADVNDAGKLEGEVILRLDADDELIRARCSLGPDDYRKALDAHGRQRHVSVRGRLMRAGRTYALEGVYEFKIIE
ncbi:MAG: hypothetical protein IPM54_11810 [Polyangiaceae bacterium]|nr:hypothetical protein [Polyangiaceae bacterium]